MNTIPPTTFSFWTLLFSGFAFIGLFYSIKLSVTKSKDNKSRVLGTYILLQSITILEYVFYWTNLIYTFPALCQVSFLFPLLFGPLLIIYVNRSFGNDKPLKYYRHHFIPFIVLLGFKLPFYVAPANFKLFHNHEILFGKFFDYYPWLLLGHLSIYSLALVILVKNHSGVGFMRLWAKWLIGFFIAYVVLSYLYYLFANFELLTPQSDYFISLASCATIFLVAWFGQGFSSVANGNDILTALIESSGRTKSVSTNEMIIEASKASAPKLNEFNYSEKYRHSGLPKSLAVKLAADLEVLMQREKLYHQNDLRLEALAEKLNSNKHFVSQVINQNFKMNFFEYINLKRIEEAKQLLRSTPHGELNIIEVAYAVGFNNKGTFNSVFKNITGVTPTEFRRQSKQLLNLGNN